jgi:hypothetical protein
MKMVPDYEAGQTVSLRYQVINSDDSPTGRKQVLYAHWEMLLACEGSETVTLTEDEASTLNEYGRFYRDF